MQETMTVHYRLADIIIAVSADLPISPATFAQKFAVFQVANPGTNTVTLHHHFGIPPDSATEDEAPVWRLTPWTITGERARWIYDGHYPSVTGRRHFLRAIWTTDYQHGHLYHSDTGVFRRGNAQALTLMPTDQVLLASLLAARQGCLVHAAGMNLWGKGFLFIGHSGAGKSTTATMLREHGEILCDDRIAVRHSPTGFRMYGTWSHSDVPDISPNSAPLHALCFLEQAERNQALRLTQRRQILARLLPCLVRAHATEEWWRKTLDVVDAMLAQIPAYCLQLDRSGEIVNVLRKIA